MQAQPPHKEQMRKKTHGGGGAGESSSLSEIVLGSGRNKSPSSTTGTFVCLKLSQFSGSSSLSDRQYLTPAGGKKKKKPDISWKHHVTLSGTGVTMLYYRKTEWQFQ